MRSSVRHGQLSAWIAVAALVHPGAAASGAQTGQVDGEWAHYGNDAGGSRYSGLAQIDRSNVGGLTVAWSYRTGDFSPDGQHIAGCPECDTSDSKFEVTPLMVDGRLLVSTPLNRVMAIDPASGREMWRFDPGIDRGLNRAEGFISRGVSYWRGATDEQCAARVFLGTVDARLIALNAEDGTPCEGFGRGGTVRLDQGVGPVQVGQYGVTSPPIVIGDVVVTGSSIGDNRRVDLERGTVKAFDARSGRLLWSWDPIPRQPGAPGRSTWPATDTVNTGAANAWAPLSADLERGLVFVPTGSASPDFYGGERIGENLYANSVVALDASSGAVRWHFQTVHHDVWDYDVPAQPTLTTIIRGGRELDVVVISTKVGFVFVLNRETGEPVFPVKEHPVPSSDVPGEQTWPTQPFPEAHLRIHPLAMTEDDVWGISDDDREACLAQFRRLRNDGVFTPPSLRGTLMFPGNAGGFNWGGLAVDPHRNVAVLNHNRLPYWVRLEERRSPNSGNQRGTPYQMTRDMMLSPSGLPCVRPPWGLVTALDLASGERLWEVPLGLMPGLEQVPGSSEWGTLGLGGPIITAGGLVFIAAGMDQKIKALDIESGAVLWQASLPAGGQATPMTYEVDGTQYVVIAAGGHGTAGTTLGDYVVAFALPR